MSIITTPFSWLLNFFYDLFGNYGMAILLFGVLVKLIMLPFQYKSKKSLSKTSALQEQMQELERRYKNNKPKYQEEVAKLYRRAGVNPMSGCIWTLIPFPILIALYSVVRQPLSRLMSLTEEEITLVTDKLVAMGQYTIPEKADAYAEMTLANLIHENFAEMQGVVAGLKDLDFNFIGLNLSSRPQWNFFAKVDWSNVQDWGPELGLFLIPVISAALTVLTSVLIRRNTPQASSSGNDPTKSMTYMMPIMSLYICFIMPAAMGVYWIIQSVLSCLEELLLGGHFRRMREKEAEKLNAVENARNAEIERRRQETERLRAEGKTEKNLNTSKKKIQAQQKAEDDARRAAAERAEREARRARLGIVKEEAPASQVGTRRYARGRAYIADRYAEEAAAAEAAAAAAEAAEAAEAEEAAEAAEANEPEEVMEETAGMEPEEELAEEDCPEEAAEEPEEEIEETAEEEAEEEQ